MKSVNNAVTSPTPVIPRRSSGTRRRTILLFPPSFIVILLSIITIESIRSLTIAESFTIPYNSMTSRSGSRNGAPRVESSSSSSVCDDSSMSETYDTLATRLIDRYNEAMSSSSSDSTGLRNNQLFVGIAGGPGSGKSTLSMAVAQRINDRMMRPTDGNDNKNNDDDGNGNGNGNEPSAPPSPACVVLPMDGFHYTRAQLQSMGSDPAIEHTHEQLLARRGSPWTFDAEHCISSFAAARRDGHADLPTYCRETSDPVSNGGAILERDTKIVLLEGNYLLAWDDARWGALRTEGVFDETWYVACSSLAEQRERLVNRHLETWSEEKTRMWGEGKEGAGRKADANDMKNLEWIEEGSRKYADLVIESV